MIIDLFTTLYILLAIVFLLVIWVFFLHHRISRLVRGSNGKSLESIINNLVEKSQDASTKSKEFEKSITYINEKMVKNISALGIVHYNAFGEPGGRQSFSIALCSENGDGLILSAICARDRTQFYIKELSTFVSKKESTPEEKEALNIAKENLKK